MSIQNEVEEKKSTTFTALVLTARDDKNEALLLLRKCVPTLFPF